jgi:hypothetical protein
MAKYFADVSGILTEVAAITASAGAGDSGKIAALDATGRFDISMMPVGIAAEVSVITASEALSAGNFVNIWANTGVANARKADSSTSSKPADGFVLAAVSSSASATVYIVGNKNTQLSAMAPGVAQYLGTAGVVTSTAPTASGSIVQALGSAESASALVFSNARFYWVKA